MSTPLNTMETYGLVPVIVLESADRAAPLAECLLEANLPLAEVTLRTEGSLQALGIMANRFPELVVGAGTVIDSDLASRAVEAGARFLVSPGFNPATLAKAGELGVPLVPGISNASLISQAREEGLRHVKFFPAEKLGGVGMLKTLSSLYRDMAFMPTGGVGPGNLADYSRLDAVFACGGSWIVEKSLVSDGNWAEIKHRIAEAQRLISEAKQ